MRAAVAAPPEPASQPLQGVLFDYGQTLITIRRPDGALREAYGEIAEYLGRHHGASVPNGPELLERVHDRLEALVEAHAASGQLEEFDLPAATTAAYVELGVPITPGQLDEVSRREQRAWWQGLTVTPRAPAVLRELRERGLRLGLCSNAPYRTDSLLGQLAHLGIGDLLDAVTFSGEVGWRKPAPELYRAALRRLGTAPRATVMVGDSWLADIAGAAGVGMRTVRLRQHRDDPGAGPEADAVIDRIDDLPPLLAGWA